MPVSNNVHILLPLLQAQGSASGRWHSYTTIPDALSGLKVASPLSQYSFLSPLLSKAPAGTVTGWTEATFWLSSLFLLSCWSAKQFTTVVQDTLALHDLSQSFL